MLGAGSRRIILAFFALGNLVATSADLHPADLNRSTDWPTLGDQLFRQSRFEQAEAAYRSAVDLDKRSVRGLLGLGRIAILFSESARAARHLSNAYQIEPLNPETILSFAEVVKDRDSRKTLLANFLARVDNADPRVATVKSQLRYESQLGSRETGKVRDSDQRYQIPLSRLRGPGGHSRGLILRGVLRQAQGVRRLNLLLDSGATGIMLNASAADGLDIEFLAPIVLGGYGSGAPAPARLALAESFETSGFIISNPLLQVSNKDLTRDSDGTIGLDAFKDFLIRVNPESLSLTQLPDAKQEFCPECLRAYRIAHLLVVRAAVNGGAEGCFILDSGSPYSLVSARLVPFRGPTSIVQGVQGAQKVTLTANPLALRLGIKSMIDFDYAMFDTNNLSEQHGIEIAGAIGYSLLRDKTLTINYRDGFLKLGKPGRD